MSYVTGMHSLKLGYQHTLMTDDRRWMTNNQNLTYRVNNGVPNQLTESISPWTVDTRAAWDAVFAQEQWTVRRLTLQGAVRFDRAYSWFPAQMEGPSRFLPIPIVVPETRGVDSYKDITPRMGAAYEMSGNGRTALKVSLASTWKASARLATTPTRTLPCACRRQRRCSARRASRGHGRTRTLILSLIATCRTPMRRIFAPPAATSAA